ncbi:cytochrome P450 [Zopfia rhizophila CBS 207.26]|uniref:Cytochrome P450 n=1 Tax=Zopfia rhizophila CBS 207.26 TaxID=1314779 RepID=A0A6A6DW75_9PEZI|nr:cytochrome P450 [Zopfia rhizophila CBS 207.26]
MKSRLCALLSTVETFALVYPNYRTSNDFILTFLALYIAQYAVLAVYNIFIYPFYRSPLRHLPGPKNGNIFFGQTLDFVKAEGPNDLLLTWMRQNPDAPIIRYLHMANSEWLLMNSVQACKEVLQTKCYAFEKPAWFRRVVGEIAGVGLVNTEGDEHRVQRKLLAGPFSLSNIKRLVPGFNDKASELSARIVSTMKENPDEPIEVAKIFSQTTLDIVGRAALGVELGSLSTSGSNFSNLYQCILDQPPAGQVISAINMFIPVRNWLPLKANRDFVHATQEVRRLLREAIRERKRVIFGNWDEKMVPKKEYTEEEGRDLLTFMIHEKSEGENKWSDEDILGHLLNFFAAGHETTAGALTWALLTLCLHPTIQFRLRAEINTQIPHSNPPSYTDLESLRYMTNFIKEVLRCYSPSTLIPRTPSSTLTLTCTNPPTVVPASTTILLNPAILHFNPTIWGPDAEVFNPERWESDHESAKDVLGSRDPYALEAFANGPRICIGRMFAMLEMKSVLVELIRNWEMNRGWGRDGSRLRDGEVCEGGVEEGLMGGVKVQNFITLKPRNGVWVKFKKID